MIRALFGVKLFQCAVVSLERHFMRVARGIGRGRRARHEQFDQPQPKPEEIVYRAKLKSSTCVIGRGHPQRMCLQSVTAMAMGHANRTVRIDPACAGGKSVLR